MKDEGQSKGNIIMVTDGPSIPNPREWRLINAWSIALCGAIITLVLLCTTGPQVYRDAIIFLPDGLLLTFKVTAYSICGAVPLGLLTGLGRISRNRFFNLLASTYVEVIRGIPLLVQIFYIYFAISMLVKMEGVTSAVIALSFCYGAYMGEVFRAGILAIPHGQTEAARSLGFNRVQTMFYVVLPLCIYVASYLPYWWRQPDFSLGDWWRCQLSMYSYHATLKATHPFESRWYTWLLGLRPVWYYRNGYLPYGMKASIAGMAGPVIWLGGLAALLWLLWRQISGRGTRAGAGGLILYGTQLIPWMLGSCAKLLLPSCAGW